MLTHLDHTSLHTSCPPRTARDVQSDLSRDVTGICITRKRYELYGGWFESTFGFDWSLAFGRDPIGDPANSTLYLVTKDAYKDMMRFMIKYAPGYGRPFNERGKALFEEVQRDLENENASPAATSGALSGSRVITPHKK